MEESHVVAPFKDEIESGIAVNHSTDHGWQKVTYAKRNKKKPNGVVVNSDPKLNNGANSVFRSLEQHSEERRRRILESQRATDDAAAAIDVPSRSYQRSSVYDDNDEDNSEGEGEGELENGKVDEVKKPKTKKPKKQKISLNDAASKIDVVGLALYLEEISRSFEEHQDIQLMRFADYFGRAFSEVAASQFPWVKMFRESPVAKIADVPLSYISDSLYKTSVDWLNKRPLESLATFVLWALDSILADLANQLAVAKGSKKGVQPTSSKSQVAMFVVVAMVLRRKPDVLVNILPTLRENPKYQGQDKLPVTVWLIAQVSQGDLCVGLYAWARNLLPLVSGKSSSPQSRDLVLQLVEKILSTPKARTILVNGAIRKGERLIPPSSFEILIRSTFPPSYARVKATERFEAIYPTLKDVALGGPSGSKAMRQAAQQICNFSLKASGESIPELSRETSGIFIWCLSQSTECYKQWEKVYQENLEASLLVLRKLSNEWKLQSVKLSPVDPLREALKNFRQKNEKALNSGADAARQSLVRDADKLCMVLLGKLSQGHGCMKFLTFTILAVAAGAVFMYPDMESWDLNKLSEYFRSLQLS